ncbi:MAG: type II secretion system F family protein, partial [Actinobacteria bacterium]|nr:type II secretion system F family protein [Actinomycetota bacterium]
VLRRPLPRARPPAWVASAVADAGLGGDPAAVWTAWLTAVGAALAVGLLLGGPALAALAVGALTVTSLAALRARRGRADADLERALPGALEAVARALRSGASLNQALHEAATTTRGRLGIELGRVTAEAGHGAGLVEALDRLAVRRPLPGVRLAVAALCLGVETGGAQARAVDGVAVTMRERLAVAAEVQALSSQARVSALVIGVAPLGFGAFAAVTDPRHARFLLHTPLGLAFVTTGLVLDGLGWLWMQRLSRVEG